jgi:hypothetical protein
VATQKYSGAAPPRLLTSYILLIVVAALLIAGFAAPNFRVSSVTVVGHNLPISTINAKSGVQGKDIFTVRSANVLANERRLVPKILVTGVQVALPNSVTVQAQLRMPVLGWRTKTSLFLVDKYGRLIKPVGATGLPTIRDTQPGVSTLGGYVDPNDITTAIYALHALGNPDLRLTLDVKRGLVIRSATGWKAIMGTPTGLELVRRIATLKQLLVVASQKKKHLHTIDLTLNPPYVSPY